MDIKTKLDLKILFENTEFISQHFSKFHPGIIIQNEAVKQLDKLVWDLTGILSNDKNKEEKSFVLTKDQLFLQLRFRSGVIKRINLQNVYLNGSFNFNGIFFRGSWYIYNNNDVMQTGSKYLMENFNDDKEGVLKK